MMQLSALTPHGVRLSGVEVDGLGAYGVAALRALLAVHGVIVFPGQHIGDEAFLRFLRSFGEVVFTEGETAVPGFPELNVVTNVGRDRPPRSQYHVDTSYRRSPPAYTALRAVCVPERGGQTLFTDQYRAYETLPAALRARIADRWVTHVATGVDLAASAESSARHPLALRHPLTGRTALYLSTRQRCAEVSGLSAEDAAELIDDLLRHSTREANVLHHRWRLGDVVMWDNRVVLHRADHEGVVGDRVLHRGTVNAPP
jgi:taurine dioxygenase